MLSTLVVFGYVAAFTVPVLCCRPKEYTARDGQCCPMCHEGTVVRRDCTPQSGTRCGLCEDGTFMNQPNGLYSCFPCTSCDPGQGLFVQQECKAASDTVCDVSSGYFCVSLTDDTGCSLAEKHKHCTPGQRIKEPGTSRTDTVCELCQPGYFSHDGVNCTAWTICSENQLKVKEGSTSSDVVCATASRNHYCYISGLLAFLTIVGLVITDSSTGDW
ncbi:tumor necrosis factor receptor superfamily member 14-like isoform X2 [Chelmon rostratus]|uniref:tumor necrosis factor receptor superfamily member 14-like isoform X2 n=1 Tax=Chelmon rostratus TaxID=109905 RepID=UPI001BE69BF2|nr:tumor necrosis factor receptor superfamily member 14-like isoform X2 [Chelmon rostratus]